MQVLMKCADISNCVRPIGICEKWVKRLCDEFFAQGDLEKSLGLVVSPFMDRDATNIPDMQTGFIDFVASPLFRPFGELLPSCKPLVESMDQNRATWQMRKLSSSPFSSAVASPSAPVRVPSSPSNGAAAPTRLPVANPSVKATEGPTHVNPAKATESLLKSSETPASVSLPAAGAAPEPKRSELPVFDQIFGLEHSANDENLMAELIGDLLREGPAHLSEISRLFRASPVDWTTLHREAHTLKSSAAMLGCAVTSDAAAELARAARAQISDQILPLLHEVEQEFARVVPLLVAERERLRSQLGDASDG